jgi:IS1 family transposase
MANVLAPEKQIAVIAALAEGSGIRQIERMTGVNRNTIMNLGTRVGKGCTRLLDAKMRDLSCGHLQFDELWGFIGKKQRRVRPEDSAEMGDVWTWVAIDAESKLVPTFAVGKRDAQAATRFVLDVKSRLANRVQVSTDGLVQYGWAMEMAFKGQVDFAQVVKVYDEQVEDAEVIRVDKTSRVGSPDLDMATTSHVERLNGTTRLHMRRLTRRTYAFSKKLENFEAAVGLHFAYYNFVKRHGTLRCTPAMAAGIEREQWTVAELVEAAV